MIIPNDSDDDTIITTTTTDNNDDDNDIDNDDDNNDNYINNNINLIDIAQSHTTGVFTTLYTVIQYIQMHSMHKRMDIHL